MSVHYLLIPPEGLLELWETDEDFDVRTTLRARDGEGRYMCMAFENSLRVYWLADPVGQINPRARQTLVDLGGPHVILTGPVMLSGLSAETVGEIVAHLSRKE